MTKSMQTGRQWRVHLTSIPGRAAICLSGWLALSLSLLASSPASAVIYKIVDAEGNVTFTDKYRPGARKLTDEGGGPVTSVDTPRRSRSVTSNPTPANFPKVDRDTQRKRDDVRKSILLEELAAEERSLSTVLASRNAGAKVHTMAEQARLAESVSLHKKNIEMLNKELARIK